MRHPTEGVLRRLIDEPAGVADADRAHVVDCDDCLRTVAAVRRDAELVHAALSPAPTGGLDTAAAWQRLTAAADSGVPDAGRVVPMPRRDQRLARRVRRPAVAAVAVAVVLAGAGTAAANDWLQVFRTERVAAVDISTADLNAMPDLRAYGDVTLTGTPDVHPVDDARTATAETGLAVPRVADLPRGVTGEPRYQVGREVSVTFTFSAERAAAAAADAGRRLPPPPPGLDGSRVRLVAGPGVAAIWTKAGGLPVLVVGRAVAPSAFSTAGVPFEVLRDYLLSLPGLPEHVAAPLRTFNADGSTLPLPVPADRFTSSTGEVDGAPATILASRDRTMAAVVWVDDGVMTVVGGTLDTDEVLSIAEGLA